MVPESWLQAQQAINPVQDQPQKSVAPISIRETETHTRKLSDMVEILPKNLRNKARVLLHYIEGKVTLNAHERIVYGDGHVGSYLLDIVRYYVSPLVKTRPLDAPRFEKLMLEIGVPTSAIGRRDFTMATGESKLGLLARWKPY